MNAILWLCHRAYTVTLSKKRFLFFHIIFIFWFQVLETTVPRRQYMHLTSQIPPNLCSGEMQFLGRLVDGASLFCHRKKRQELCHKRLQVCKRASILGNGFARLNDARFSKFTYRRDESIGWVFRLSRHRRKLSTFDDTSASREFRAPTRGKAESAYCRPGIRKRRPVSLLVCDYDLPKVRQRHYYFFFFFL
uniref:Putative secreted protein n=1 Tax=Ixodes scapularis TaxID=6945 RepID=A0A4D5RC90_IXOSC